MSDSARKPSVRTVQDAFETVVESGHRLILDRIDLLQMDLTAQAAEAGRKAGARVVGGVLALGAWIALCIAAAQGLSVWIMPWAASAIVGVVHAVLATGLFLYQPQGKPGDA